MTKPTITDEDRAAAKRWMGQLPRDQFDKLLLLINDTRQAAFNAGLERAAVIADRAWRPDVGTAIRAEKEKP